MKKQCPSTRHAGLAILAGALSFMGSASAVTVFSENFEGQSNIFLAPTYTYDLNYTLPNTLTPGGDLQYMHGGPGTPGSPSTNTFPATISPVSLVIGGITTAQIDGGGVTYNFYGQFSTYAGQNDFGEVEIRFLDGSNALIGGAHRIGSSALVTALPGGVDIRGWAADQLTGAVPVGARSVALVAFETKTASGTNIDGYMDNISLNINAVPEPSAGLSVLLAGSVLAARRRRRGAQ